MGNFDDPAPGSKAGRGFGSTRSRSLRSPIRACHPRLDDQGSHRARPYRRSPRGHGGKGRGLVPRVQRWLGRVARTRPALGRQIMERVGPTPRVHPFSWKWWICGLPLLASAINYMDRQTLANAAVRITAQFQLNQEQYGNLELIFGWAFALGSTLFGVAVDRLPVRWLYPVVLTLWSVVGFATGLVNSYGGLLACRSLLGPFEGGHWPCAIKTTRLLLEPRDR